MNQGNQVLILSLQVE